jgi:hypothetical protein
MMPASASWDQEDSAGTGLGRFTRARVCSKPAAIAVAVPSVPLTESGGVASPSPL